MTATVEENKADTTEGAVGRIARVIGPVVDIEFPVDSMPDMYNKLECELDLAGEKHDALARGRPAHRRRHGPRDLAAADRRPGPRRAGHRHRRPDHRAGRRRDPRPRVQHARRAA